MYLVHPEANIAKRKRDPPTGSYPANARLPDIRPANPLPDVHGQDEVP